MSVTINNLNCSTDRIFVVSDNDNNHLYVFANIDIHGFVCSKYSINGSGQLVQIYSKHFDTGLYILNPSNLTIGDLRSIINKIDFVSHTTDDKFVISTTNSVITFTFKNDLQINSLNKTFANSDIMGPIITPINVSEDLVSFGGYDDLVGGMNITPDPILGINKFLNFNVLNVIKKDLNGKSVLEVSNVDDKLSLKNDTTNTYAEVIQKTEISYDGTVVSLNGSLVIGMCFFNNELFYVKVKCDDEINLLDINMKNHNIFGYPVLCSLTRGELIEFKIKSLSSDVFLDNVIYYNEFIKLKSIKTINNNLVLLFENHNPIYISSNFKEYTVYKSKYGVITSLDYINGLYIAGLSVINKDFSIADNADTVYTSYGICVMKGDNLSNLSLVETCPVKDIIVDTYRNYIYISTKFEFRVYDYSLSLLKKYMVNPFNLYSYSPSNVNIRNRFLLNSDVEDVRRIIASTGEIYQDTISFNDSVETNNQKILCTGNYLDGLSTGNSYSFISDNKTKNPEYINLSSIPLFANNLNGVRAKDKFSIFSKDNDTGVIVELSYDNNIIVTCPNNVNKHDTKRTVIVTGIIPVIDKINYNNIGLKIKDRYILLRVGQNLRIHTIDWYNNSLTASFQTTLPAVTFPEVASMVIHNSKLLIAFGDTQILELTINGNDITFNRYITMLFKIHQIEKFENNLICIHSLNNDVGYLGILSENETNGFNLDPLEVTKLSNIVYNNTNIPTIKIDNENVLSIIYSDSIILSFDKNSIFSNKYLDSDFQNNYDLLNPVEKITSVLSLDNESMRKTKNRNFIKDVHTKVDSYKHPYELNNINDKLELVGVMRDFDSDTIFNIVTDSKGNILVSETYGGVKRIDITVDMGNSNIVKVIKTDNFELHVDEVLYPKISTYLENVLDTDLNKLCTFILG